VAWKIFPALLCGNAVVAKSHELTPYTTRSRSGACSTKRDCRAACTRSCRDSDRKSAAPLISDDRVGLVSFTGSVPTGKQIQQSVSGRAVLAKVCLELGGKNPLVVCDDADVTAEAEHAVASAFVDAGQRCASGSRLIVFDRVYDGSGMRCWRAPRR